MNGSDWLDAVRRRLRGLEEAAGAGEAGEAEALEYTLLAAAYGASVGIAQPKLLTVADIADYLTEIANLPDGKTVTAESVISMRNRNNPNRTEDEIAKAPSCPAPAMQFGVRKPVDVWFEGQLPAWGKWYLEQRPGRGKGGGRPPGRRDDLAGVTPGGA